MSDDTTQPVGAAAAITADNACAMVDRWGENETFGLHHIARALRAEVARLQKRVAELENEVVFGFYEEEKPIYAQGYKGAGGCELAEPVTAAELNSMVDCVSRLRVSVGNDKISALKEWHEARQDVIARANAGGEIGAERISRLGRAERNLSGIAGDLQ